MFRTLTLAVLAFSAAGSMTALAAEFNVDQTHSTVGFSVRHMVSKVQGRFSDFEGKFNFDESKPSESKLVATARTASIDTNNAKRDEHLKGEDFFDAKKCPALKFESKSITGSGKKFSVAGDLTMHCVTKPLTLEVEYNGETKDPWGNQRAGFAATGKLNRKDWGIVWNKTLDAGSVMLGDEIELKLDVEAIVAKAEPAAPAKKTEAKKKK